MSGALCTHTEYRPLHRTPSWLTAARARNNAYITRQKHHQSNPITTIRPQHPPKHHTYRADTAPEMKRAENQTPQRATGGKTMTQNAGRRTNLEARTPNAARAQMNTTLAATSMKQGGEPTGDQKNTTQQLAPRAKGPHPLPQPLEAEERTTTYHPSLRP